MRARVCFSISGSFASILARSPAVRDVAQTAVLSTVPRSCEVFGSAVSGQTEMHSMHCVQFSGMYSGVSRRATYFDAVSPVAAAITPSAASGVAG